LVLKLSADMTNGVTTVGPAAAPTSGGCQGDAPVDLKAKPYADRQSVFAFIPTGDLD
jgi:hypothetical protein